MLTWALQTPLRTPTDTVYQMRLCLDQKPEKEADPIIVHPDVRRMLRRKSVLSGRRREALIQLFLC